MSNCTAVTPPGGDGWVSCAGVVTVKALGKTITSGYVSAFMNWGCAVGTNCAAYYHGDATVGVGTAPATFTVNTVSTYLPRANCKPTMATTIDLYDGRQGAAGAPLLLSAPITLTLSCG